MGVMTDKENTEYAQAHGRYVVVLFVALNKHLNLTFNHFMLRLEL